MYALHGIFTAQPVLVSCHTEQTVHEEHVVNKINPSVISLINSKTFMTYLIQSIIGHTDKQSMHPVQSSVTVGMCVSGSKVMAWYPESLQVM